MREIKFRGKRVDNGEWVYGVPYTKEIFNTEYKKIIGYKTYIITYLADDLRSIERDEVDPNTVGQFTGLHDKNGVEIYEGDILSDGYLSTRVYWNYTEAGFSNGVCDWRKLLPHLESIGNIHKEVGE